MGLDPFPAQQSAARLHLSIWAWPVYTSSTAHNCPIWPSPSVVVRYLLFSCLRSHGCLLFFSEQVICCISSLNLNGSRLNLQPRSYPRTSASSIGTFRGVRTAERSSIAGSAAFSSSGFSHNKLQCSLGEWLVVFFFRWSLQWRDFIFEYSWNSSYILETTRAALPRVRLRWANVQSVWFERAWLYGEHQYWEQLRLLCCFVDRKDCIHIVV
jgi:hypothetical protein